MSAGDIREGGLRPPTPAPDRWFVDPPSGPNHPPAMTFDTYAEAEAYQIRCPPRTRIIDRYAASGDASYPEPDNSNAINPPNPKQRYGDTKVNLALVPPAGVIFAALGFHDGGIKYGPFNWRQDAVEIMTYIAACRRHLDAFVDGEELSEKEIWQSAEDVQSVSLGSKPHLGHAIACLMILADAMSIGHVIDNRPLPGPAPSLLRKWKRDLAR
jgi:hypothetical protein